MHVIVHVLCELLYYFSIYTRISITTIIHTAKYFITKYPPNSQIKADLEIVDFVGINSGDFAIICSVYSIKP